MTITANKLRQLGEELARDFRDRKGNLPERSHQALRAVGLAKVEEFQALKAAHLKGFDGHSHMLPGSGFQLEKSALDIGSTPYDAPASNSHDANLLLDEMLKMREEVKSPLSTFQPQVFSHQHLSELQMPQDQKFALPDTGGLQAAQGPDHFKPEEQGTLQSAPGASILDNLVNMPVTPPLGSARDHSLPFHSGTSAERFTALQEHIDKLTDEKFELQRALETQGKVTSSLSSENQELTESYNRQGKSVEDLKKRCGQYEEEIHAQSVSLENFGNQRDADKALIQELQERIKALVEENLELEERNRELRIGEVRHSKKFEHYDEVKESLQVEVNRLRKEMSSMQDVMAMYREENSALKSSISTGKLSTAISHPETSVRTVAASTQTYEDTMHISPPAEAKHDFQDHSAGTIPMDGAPADFPPRLLLGFLTGLNSSSAVMSPEESKALSSVDRLLKDLEEQRRASMAEIARLKSANHELLQKLAMQTQRLELAGIYGLQTELPAIHTQRASSSDNGHHSRKSTAGSIESLTKIQPITPITRTQSRDSMVKRRWFFW